MHLHVISPAQQRASAAGRALCEGTPLGLWFGPAEEGPAESLAERAARTERAKALCAGCPLRSECLAAELTHPARDQHGIRGGLTAVERRRLVRSGAGAGGGWAA